MIAPATIEEMRRAAEAAALRAYSPYSKFPVGAAVLSGSGKIFSGCNIENASYGLTNCAERTAVFAAVQAGERAITAVAIYTPTSASTAPCGACRQVLNEFGPDSIVYCFSKASEPLVARLAELLPLSFGPKSLG